MTKKKVDKFREEINKIDQELLFLFNRRATVVVELAKIKCKLGKKLFDPEREKDIFVSAVKVGRYSTAIRTHY
jgi:chorismate mutase